MEDVVVEEEFGEEFDFLLVAGVLGAFFTMKQQLEGAGRFAHFIMFLPLK